MKLRIVTAIAGSLWLAGITLIAAGNDAPSSPTPKPATGVAPISLGTSTPPPSASAQKPGMRLETPQTPKKRKKQVSYEYDGVLVRASRTEEPLELLNPYAAPSYGSGETFVLRNLHTQKVEGIRLFGIRF